MNNIDLKGNILDNINHKHIFKDNDKEEYLK